VREGKRENEGEEEGRGGWERVGKERQKSGRGGKGRGKGGM